MKGFNMFIVLSLFFVLGHAQDAQEEMRSFGEGIQASGTISGQEMSERYNSMSVSDTLQAKFRGVVREVCQVKGCWMRVELGDGEEVMVRFKDYGFFVPKDIAGKEVIVNGLAFIKEMGVGEQRHYAEDAGKSEAEIAKITEPKKTLGFTADGVLLKD
ncbi:MAG: DUF4920 domain-containing protein [Maribacter sp.]|nr:MAG: DUF4920 domain-containing protein [Maribacter sp.]